MGRGITIGIVGMLGLFTGALLNQLGHKVPDALWIVAAMFYCTGAIIITIEPKKKEENG